MRFVAVKSEEQQARGMLFRTRDLLVRRRTQTINALRGHLAEFGFIAPQGLAHAPSRTAPIAYRSDPPYWTPAPRIAAAMCKWPAAVPRQESRRGTLYYGYEVTLRSSAIVHLRTNGDIPQQLTKTGSLLYAIAAPFVFDSKSAISHSISKNLKGSYGSFGNEWLGFFWRDSLVSDLAVTVPLQVQALIRRWVEDEQVGVRLTGQAHVELRHMVFADHL